MSARFSLNTTLFHFSREHPNEFMRAGTIHLGDAQGAIGRSANTNRRFSEPSGAVYALDTTHMNVDPDLMLTDAEANTAERLFLKSNRLPVPESNTAVPGEDWEDEGVNFRSVYSAVRALRENRAVRYENDFEGGNSLLAPTPHINTHILEGGKAVSPRDLLDHSAAEGSSTLGSQTKHLHSADMYDSETIDKHLLQPRSNPSLPVDWSTIEKSEITKRGGHADWFSE